MTQRASIEVEVKDPVDAAMEGRQIAKKLGGFVQTANVYEDSASITVQVPSASLEEALDAFAELGKETARAFHAEDVTDGAMNLEALIKSKEAAKERLKTILAEAESEKRVLEIDTSLRKIQAELDQLYAQQRKLENTVVYSQLDLHLDKRIIDGPIVVALKGVGWAIKQLFRIG